MGLFDSEDQKQSSESTSTSELYQQDQLDKLLSGAESWLGQGGLNNQPNYTSQMAGVLGQIGNQYQSVLSGEQDRTALNNSLQAQADAAQTNFNRNVLPSIGTSSNMTGASGGSRRGIAEGIAAGDMQAALMQNQANTINQFEQQAMQNKMNAAQGMGNLFQQVGALQQQASSQTDQAKQLQSLMAFKDLLSGNMGGTTTQEGTQTSSGGGQSFGSQLLGAGATIAGGMMMSDERLKDDERQIGTQKLKDGSTIGIYEWSWNKTAKKMGLGKAPTVGVLAQDAKKLAPDAVTKTKDGYLAVNYGLLAKHFDPKSEPHMTQDTKANKKAKAELKRQVKAEAEKAIAAESAKNKADLSSATRGGALGAPPATAPQEAPMQGALTPAMGG